MLFIQSYLQKGTKKG